MPDKRATEEQLESKLIRLRFTNDGQPSDSNGPKLGVLPPPPKVTRIPALLYHRTAPPASCYIHQWIAPCTRAGCVLAKSILRVQYDA